MPAAQSCRLLQIAGLVVSVAVLAACSRSEPPPDPVRAVKVMTIAPTAFQSGHEFSGEVRPRVESRLGFRVAGKIVRRQAELGQRVQAGQVLAQLDAQDYRLAADAARAQVAAAQTNRDLAAADYRRFQTLRDQNFISGAELERRETALKAAQAQLEQAQAQLAAQGNQTGYTELVADVSGVVTGVEAEPGQVVAAGAPVVRIAQDGPRDVVFAVPEDRVAAVRVGSEVTVRPWAAETTLTGRVREVAASADPVTRTYAVKVGLESPTPPPLGATVTVVPQALSLAGTPVIKIPTSALRQQGQGSAVWVLDTATMTVRSQPVEVATADGNDAVVSAGLQPGMRIVSAGVHVLSAGQKVTIWQDRGAALPATAGSQPAQAAAGTAQAATLPATTR
ncbi:efflux RND transporter periplasmic adaptor subunit [Ramlibacter sp.]|uniref:efflux RND transporter periplasmic adaptor subunit n=1 Tax=Ramlibacter sp. TaxID=1917967 RepID=UPI0035B25D7D